jgi:flagellar hook assembly protein FlgD
MPVRLAVYDVEGRLVRVLTEGKKAAGDHTATWDGLDAHDHRAGSGIYFLRLEAGNRAVSRKAVFLR